MSILTKKELNKIASLARLFLNKDEGKKFTEQLSSILDYFKKLQEVNTDGVVATNQITDLKNVMRADKVDQFFGQKNLIKSAPDKQDNLIKTKKVFDLSSKQ